MTTTTLKSPSSGKTLIPVANRTTTPAKDDSVKKIEVQREYVEVIVSDSRLISAGSQWGHVAIAIDDRVYSRAHEEYVVTTKQTYMHGGEVQRANDKLHVAGNGWRDSAGIVLWLSSREKEIVQKELERRVEQDRKFRKKHPSDSTYSIFDNSCSSNVADVLELVGILAHDPRWLPFPVAPGELLAVIQKSNRFVKKNYYPKESKQ